MQTMEGRPSGGGASPLPIKNPQRIAPLGVLVYVSYFLTMVMQWVGQASTHAPQAVHLVGST